MCPICWEGCHKFEIALVLTFLILEGKDAAIFSYQASRLHAHSPRARLPILEALVGDDVWVRHRTSTYSDFCSKQRCEIDSSSTNAQQITIWEQQYGTCTLGASLITPQV